MLALLVLCLLVTIGMHLLGLLRQNGGICVLLDKRYKELSHFRLFSSYSTGGKFSLLQKQGNLLAKTAACLPSNVAHRILCICKGRTRNNNNLPSMSRAHASRIRLHFATMKGCAKLCLNLS